MATSKNTVIEIKPIELETVSLRIVGTSPLIMHKWSEKAKKMILDAQMKTSNTKTKGKSAREAKNPVEDFITSMYWLTEEPKEYTEQGFENAVTKGARWGFPASAIKQCAITSGYRSGVTKDMASLRGAFFIEGEGADQCVEIKGCIPHIREDMVRVGMGTADIRFRGEFSNWYADLKLTYNKNGQYSLSEIVNLLNLGGFACGIGEWRPEKDGSFGCFKVEAE